MAAHLTMTGPYAGLAFCGSYREPGETYKHLPYLRREASDAFVRAHVSCEACKAEYFEGDDQ